MTFQSKQAIKAKHAKGHGNQTKTNSKTKQKRIPGLASIVSTRVQNNTRMKVDAWMDGNE